MVTLYADRSRAQPDAVTEQHRWGGEGGGGEAAATAIWTAASAADKRFQ